jgi:thiamine biosynthesis lipoprotein
LTTVVNAPPVDNQHIYRTLGLGCRAEIWVTDVNSLVGAIEILHQELERIDRAASRFRVDSEIAVVQRAEGRPVTISSSLVEAVSVALRVAEATDGAVDPTVGNAMNRLGYDRDFAQIAGGVLGSLPEESPVVGWRSIKLDRANRTLRVPPGTLIDLGATAKALTADRIAQRVSVTLGCGVLVSLGGDIAVGGPSPSGGFRVGLADVSGDVEACETVAIASGGLATSGIMSRRWRLGHHIVNHIVDPSTGLSPMPAWRTVTVTAESCVDANAASTAAMVKGADAIQWLDSLQLPSRLIAVDGRILRVAGWPAGASVMSELAESSRGC